MATFKAGDKVVCTDSDGLNGWTQKYLTEGRVYTVSEYNTARDLVSLCEVPRAWLSDRFRHATLADLGGHGGLTNPTPDFGVPDPARGAPAAPRQALPDSNPKTRFGVAKPPLALIPAPAMLQMAEAFRDGAAKYGAANWRKDPVSASTYVNAALRHIVAWYDGEEVAPDSKVHHLGHAAACLAIILDAQLCGTLLNDRPPPAPTGDIIKVLTKPMS